MKKIKSSPTPPRRKYYLINTITLLAISSLFSCSGGGSGNNIENTSTQKTFVELGKTIESEYGTAKLVFKNGVVLEVLSKANDLGIKTVLIPHNGTNSIQLQINDPDSSKVDVLGEVNNPDGTTTPLPDHPFFGINSGGQKVTISGYDLMLGQDVNTDAVEVPINNGQGVLDWKFVDSTGNSEGKIYEIENLRLANLLQQGSSNVLDIGDYFKQFNTRFNALPKFAVVGSSSCYVNPVDTDGDGKPDRFEIPPGTFSAYNCLTLQFTNPDGLGYNPQWSYDNTTFNPIDYTQLGKIDFSNGDVSISEGQTKKLYITIKEFLDQDQTISDKKVSPITVYKDLLKVGNTDLVGTVTDYTTGNTWTVNDLAAVEFADPGSNTNAGKITVTGSSAPYGTCNVYVRKDGTNLYNQTMPCNNINISYTVPASDRGTGAHSLEFTVYKYYRDGSTDSDKVEVLLDNIALSYKVNEAPTTNP